MAGGGGAVGGAAGGSAAAAAAAIAKAIKASGAIVRVTPDNLMAILGRQEKPLVLHSPGGFLSVMHRYLTSYRGLAFFAKSAEPLNLPGDSEIIEAEKIWVP